MYRPAPLALALMMMETMMATPTGAQTLAPNGSESRPFRPVVGQAFPDLVLPSLDDGRPLSLADFHGKKVILHVFASW